MAKQRTVLLKTPVPKTGFFEGIVAKIWRSFERTGYGPSNMEVVSTPPQTGAVFGMAGIVAGSTTIKCNKEGPLQNQLEFAQGGIVLEGPPEDVHAIRCFDNMVGHQGLSFANLQDILLHEADLAGSFQRVSAHLAAHPAVVVWVLEYPMKPASEDVGPLSKVIILGR
jgi:hypothetical protein